MSGALAVLEALGVPDPARQVDAYAARKQARLDQMAAEELHVAPGRCFVAEDAPAGIQAARAGGMAAPGVARLHDEAGLQAAKADIVIASLDGVCLAALVGGLLEALA